MEIALDIRIGVLRVGYVKKTAGFLAVLRNKKKEESFQTKHKIGENSLLFYLLIV